VTKIRHFAGGCHAEGQDTIRKAKSAKPVFSGLRECGVKDGALEAHADLELILPEVCCEMRSRSTSIRDIACAGAGG
jgi:hypothetical protein